MFFEISSKASIFANVCNCMNNGKDVWTLIEIVKLNYVEVCDFIWGVVQKLRFIKFLPFWATYHWLTFFKGTYFLLSRTFSNLLHVFNAVFGQLFI